MGDIGNGIAYLCGTCCCVRNAEVSADGSRFGSRTKPDPRERQIDEEFMSRNYRQDAAGRFYRQPTPTSSMLPRQLSDESKKSIKNPDTKAQGSGEPERQELNANAPQLAVEKSTSTNATGISNSKEATDIVELDVLHAPG
ncbi:hypothetical protein BDZ97DRAFT_1912605 [Flammula alnicola]|nr:hypothetical protein BDZ97DRAFT_1912605 [Flammula alnicola]